MSHPLLLSHLPFTSSTSSSSFTLPSTTTQEHAAQPVQHGRLQEHPVRHEHLHALPVDKQRPQESLWRKDLQSGEKPCTTTPAQKRFHRRLSPSHAGTRSHECFSSLMSLLTHVCCNLRWLGNQLSLAPLTRRSRSVCSDLSVRGHCLRSSAAHGRTLGIRRLRYAVLELGDSRSGTVNTDHSSATMWV